MKTKAKIALFGEQADCTLRRREAPVGAPILNRLAQFEIMTKASLPRQLCRTTAPRFINSQALEYQRRSCPMVQDRRGRGGTAQTPRFEPSPI